MTFAQSNEDDHFAVYLVPRALNSDAGKINLEKLRPSKSSLFDVSDILYYRAATHEFQLDFPAAERLRKSHKELRGKPFAVFLGRRAVYVGAFWTSLWSQSFDGIVLDLDSTKPDYPVLQFRDGYPDKTYFKGPDLRAGREIFESLEKSGKLYDELQFVVKCRNIVATGKRRASFVFTFDVVEVSKGRSDETQLELEIYDGKLLPELSANFSTSTGKELSFDREQLIVLNYMVQRGAAKPDRLFVDFAKK